MEPTGREHVTFPPTAPLVPSRLGSGVLLYEGNCGEILPMLSGVDLVITDPPWHLHKYTKELDVQGAIGDENEASWFKILWTWNASWLPLVARAGAVRGWYFIGWYQMAPFLRIATVIGLPVQHIFPKVGEEWLVYIAPEPLSAIPFLAVQDCYSAMPYTNRKPDALLQELIASSPRPHDAVILDPFAGEGSTLVAAHLMHCRAIGIEMKPEYCAMIRAKLAATS